MPKKLIQHTLAYTDTQEIKYDVSSDLKKMLLIGRRDRKQCIKSLKEPS